MHAATAALLAFRVLVAIFGQGDSSKNHLTKFATNTQRANSTGDCMYKGVNSSGQPHSSGHFQTAVQSLDMQETPQQANDNSLAHATIVTVNSYGDCMYKGFIMVSVRLVKTLRMQVNFCQTHRKHPASHLLTPLLQQVTLTLMRTKSHKCSLPGQTSPICPAPSFHLTHKCTGD